MHILDSYNAIPHSFDRKAIMDYVNRMADFYYITLKKINADYLIKQNEETKEFVILRDLIKYEKELEAQKGGQKIQIKEV